MDVRKGHLPAALSQLKKKPFFKIADYLIMCLKAYYVQIAGRLSFDCKKRKLKADFVLVAGKFWRI